VGVKIIFPGLAFGLLLAVAPLLAHHSFSSVFDQEKAVTLTGVVTKVDWMNPHTYFYIDVKDENSKVVNWGCESGPPGMLTRNGWKKDTLKIGDQVKVEGYAAKDGSHLASARQIVLSDGRKVLAGTAADEKDTQK
jgi:hypothetical protein